MTPTVQKFIDRMEACADTGRLRRDLVETLEDEPFSRFGEWAESLSEIADAVTAARDAVQEWAEEEDRASRADAKEVALEALETLVQTWNGSPLDVTKLCDAGLLADWDEDAALDEAEL